MTKQKLKPCPFCGSEATLDKLEWIREDEQESWAGCNSNACYIQMFGRDDDEAVERWNKRVEQTGKEQP